MSCERNHLKVLCLVFLSMLLLSACGPKQTEPAVEVSEEPPAEITIEFWDYTNPGVYEPWWEEFIASYESSHPGVTIERTGFAEKDYDNKLRTAMAAGSEPDIMFVISGSAIIDYASSGKIASLDNLVDQSIWVPSLLGAFGYEGKIYAVPLGPMASPMWYDESLFKEYAVVPPETWDDLLGLCDFFNGVGITPLSLAGIERWEIMMYYDYLQHQYGGYDLLDQAARGQGADFTNEAFNKAGSRLQELFANGCFPEQFMGLDQDQMTAAFFNGEAAMELIGPWVVGMAKDMAPEGFQLRAFRFPALPDAIAGTEKDLEGGVNGFAISASCEHPEVAADFLNEFGKANQNFVNEIGYLPTVPGVSVEDPIMAEVAGFMSEANVMFTWADRRLPSAIVDDYLNSLVSLAAGEMTPEEFGRTMTDIVEEKVE